MAFLGCDQVQGVLGIGEEEGGKEPGGNNEVPDTSKRPVAFRTYYAAASGNDKNDGTSESPLKTVTAALGKLAADYAKDDWPDEEESNEAFGEIIIRGLVTSSSAIVIEGAGYPSIVLRGESGGKSRLVWSGSTAATYLLQIKNGAKVTLEEDLTLTRIASNNGSVSVSADGTFTMNGGDISGHSSYGVNLYGGTFTMNGGNIVDNRSSYGAVRLTYDKFKVKIPSSFTMNGGTIAGNYTAGSGAGTSSEGSGGGVYVDTECSFTMNGGIIANNYSDGGGGVYSYGTFTMNGGDIVDNSAREGGGGVYSSGTVTMNAGNIANNYSDSGGGGVYVSFQNSFTMVGGTIAGNYSDSEGGGVWNKGTFTMGGGTIAGNSASIGGGVFVNEFADNGPFLKIGGIIYGVNGGKNANTATVSSRGHAVYVSCSEGYEARDATAGDGVVLNSKTRGAAGGWE
jgi:predicted outer membrane repeat protein